MFWSHDSIFHIIKDFTCEVLGQNVDGMCCRVGQLGIDGFGGEEDTNAAPAHYRVRGRRKRRRLRAPLGQRATVRQAQTRLSYFLSVDTTYTTYVISILSFKRIRNILKNSRYVGCKL